jgi:hypothetical protein
MLRVLQLLSALVIAVPALVLAQQVTPPEEGGPPAGRVASIGRDAGPADQSPRTDSPDAVNRGTDGSVVGQEEAASTGTTPQGFLGTSTAGAPDPDAPVGGAPPRSGPALR